MLFKKMWRDIIYHKTQFIAIFIMIFLGVFIYTGINSEWNGLLYHSQNFYTETNLSDGLIMGESFEKEDVHKLKENKEIQDAERRAVFQVHEKSNVSKSLDVYLLEGTSLSQMKVMSGETFDLDKTGIWINQNYADENNIQIGDKITLENQGIVIEETIRGIVLHPEFVYSASDNSITPDFKNQGYAFISANQFQYTNMIPFTQILIKTNNENPEKIIKQQLNDKNMTYIDKEDLSSYNMIQSEISQHQAFADVFPIVFLFIAFLTTITTITKLIINQRLQIGVLKALGLSQIKIFTHYLSHILFITIIAAILGYILGPMIVPEIIYPMMRTIYSLPELYAVPLDISILLVILVIVISFVISFIVCYHQLKESASQLMRPVVIKYKGHIKKEKSIWKHLRFYEQWNLRDMMRNKVRSLMAIVGIAGCMGLLFCAFGLQDSMTGMIDMNFKDLNQFDIQVNVNDKANIDDLKAKIDGSTLQQNVIEINNQEKSQTYAITIQENTQYMKIIDTDLKEIPLPQNGIALSYKIAEKYNVKKDDIIEWRLLGENNWVKSYIKDIIHTPSTQGITMSKEEYEKTNHQYQVTSIVGKDKDIKNEVGVNSIQYLQEDIKEGMDTMMEGMNLMIAILVLAAIILGSVVIYNIGTFAYIEKIRDIATLKVVGFQDKQVKKILRQQNFFLTLIGICFGIPFGYFLIYIIISTIGESMDLLIQISMLTFVICIIGTLFLSTFIMIIITRKTKHIDMVSALKSIE
ncbi:MAG: ABC transporter permease [Coprobacillus sp.]